MNNLDKFRYSFDDPSQLNISLKKDPYEKATNQKSDNINQLLSTSVRVTKEIFPNINVLYGGSLNSANAQDILSISHVNGGLVGGASLDASEFVSIIRSAHDIC